MITEEIRRLKERRNAVILAHSYQPPEVQDIADYVGDSLGLSLMARKTAASVIVFCGVHFMAETAKILCPEKTVLLPVVEAGCPMAEMITAVQMRDFKDRHPGVPSICYVNTSAAVKAECDCCCTSANAAKLVGDFVAPGAPFLFVPDRNLADFVAQQAGRVAIPWNGYCPVHEAITPSHVEQARGEHPRAVVLAHPECPPETLRLADFVTSTEGMIAHSRQVAEEEFIIATEVGILYRLRRECPNKAFYPAKDDAVCEDMKKTSLEAVLAALMEMRHVVEVEEGTAKRALRSLQAMVGVV